MALSNLDKDNICRLMESLALSDFESFKNTELMKSNSTSYGKLSMIISQIESLQTMGKQVIAQCELNNKLHNAICKFQKSPNNVYHFYINEDVMYCSMLSPEDWKGNPPHVFYGSYLLKPDMEFCCTS